MLSLLLISLLLFLLGVRFWWTHRKFFKLAKLVKHDILRLPIIGVFHLFSGDGVSIMKGLEEIGKEALRKGGIIGDWFGHRFVVVIGDPIAANHLSRESLEKHDVMVKCMSPVLGQCHLLAPVPIWRPRRKLASTLFVTKNMKQYVIVINNECKTLAKNLESTVDKHNKIFRSLLKCTMEILFKTSINANLDLQNSDHSFVDDIETITTLIGLRFCKPWYYSDFIYKLMPEFKTLSTIRKEVFDYVQQSITKARDNVKQINNALKDEEPKPLSFLEQLIVNSKSNFDYTDEELREEILILVTAGSDTTAIAAAFTIAMLARFPELQERVFQEIQQVLGDESYIELEKVSELKYLNAFIMECLRLFAPTPLIARTCEQDVELPNGIVIPEGCGVVLHLWAINRNKEYWGPDADEFRPERFLDPDLKLSALFGSFSFGPRNCVGMRFAMTTLRTMISTIVRRYKILPASQLTGKPEEFRCHYGVTMKDADDFPVILKLRT